MGSPVVSSAAVPQRPCSGVAQPQSCMKESLTDTTLTLTIDRTTCSCRASEKSTLLELLLHLHITVGAIELQRTNECSSTGRARCAMQPPSRRRHADTSPPCRQQGVNRSSRRAAPASLHSRMCRLRTVPRIHTVELIVKETHGAEFNHVSRSHLFYLPLLYPSGGHASKRRW